MKKRSQELEEAEDFDVAEVQNVIHATSNADNIEDELLDYDDETFLERPDYLDLTGEDQKKPSYYFNSRIGTCLQLDFWELTFQREKDKRRPSQWSFSA